MAHLHLKMLPSSMMFQGLLLHGKVLQHASSDVVCKYFIVQYCTKSVISLEANVFLILILEQDVKETFFSSLKLDTFMFSAEVLHQPNGFSELTSKAFIYLTC